jgi:hypothetical protein
VLLDPGARQVTAVLDPLRGPVEDLAWWEWVVRMSHPAHVDALDGFFDAYGAAPPGRPGIRR